MNGRTILVWFRNDLRVHDNEILLEAVKRAENIVPVYCFDPRYFTETPYDTQKTGAFRARFLLESVNGLRKSLQKLGGDLMIKIGAPEKILPEICQQYSISEVYHHREVAAEETEISANVEAALWKLQINLKHFIGHTLYHKEDLPFPIKDIPDAFITFKKKIERDSDVRPGFATPSEVKVPKDMEQGELPSLSDLGLPAAPADERAQYSFSGGEEEGLRRLTAFLNAYKSFPVKGNKNVNTVTSMLSPWLSMGCLSPREVYWQVKGFDREHMSHDLAAAIVLELQWRDYFRFMLKKHGSNTTSHMHQLSDSEKGAFNLWKQGKTGNAIVDACITELNSTGYINSKCRQYVAMYLVKEAGVSWKAGAAYFEEKLIDYSPASNWGNWTYIAGEGVMSVNRPIAMKADPFVEEQYIQKWIQKLNELQ
ncbi:DASH family cryptochrome [Paradesertivirga mongoliensis]|uniref:Cryptochrome DASH n=1 Tax=Paradesertivirga mongoliensis TaxID=2100740 RepID=A0ABW4ZK83_9SPHI|nr:DASH family cryptochrome [Pedobacter mongoliensis]